MEVSSQNPRSLLASLLIFGGWVSVIFGAFILITGGREGLGAAFRFLVSGGVSVWLIYYLERWYRRHDPAKKVSPQNPRSMLVALLLLNSWMDMLLGVFMIVTGGRDGVVSGLSFMISGGAFVWLIHEFERSRKTV
jgi:hypothetical protein